MDAGLQGEGEGESDRPGPDGCVRDGVCSTHTCTHSPTRAPIGRAIIKHTTQSTTCSSGHWEMAMGFFDIVSAAGALGWVIQGLSRIGATHRIWLCSFTSASLAII